MKTAWLIEKNHPQGPRYACVKNGVLDWTEPGDHLGALRLCRREDADALCSIMEDADKVAEHAWHEFGEEI